MIRDGLQEGPTARRIKSMEFCPDSRHCSRTPGKTFEYDESLCFIPFSGKGIVAPDQPTVQRPLQPRSFDKGVAMPLIHRHPKHTELHTAVSVSSAKHGNEAEASITAMLCNRRDLALQLECPICDTLSEAFAAWLFPAHLGHAILVADAILQIEFPVCLVASSQAGLILAEVATIIPPRRAPTAASTGMVYLDLPYLAMSVAFVSPSSVIIDPRDLALQLVSLIVLTFGESYARRLRPAYPGHTLPVADAIFQVEEAVHVFACIQEGLLPAEITATSAPRRAIAVTIREIRLCGRVKRIDLQGVRRRNIFIRFYLVR